MLVLKYLGEYICKNKKNRKEKRNEILALSQL